MHAVESTSTLSPGPDARRGRFWLSAAIAAWALAALTGMVWIWQYESTPGTATAAPPRWPVESRLRPGGDPVVLMFAHPYCACTGASLGELAIVMSRVPANVHGVVVFSMPGEHPARWVEGSSWRTAAAIPGVTLMADPDGAESRRFGAATSGMVVAYDEHGDLAFQGGITGARGHEGDNPGRARLIDALIAAAPSPAASTSPVFGCGLEAAALADHGGTTP